MKKIRLFKVKQLFSFFLLAGLLIGFHSGLSAQITLDGYTGLLDNNSSQGIKADVSGQVSAQFGTFTASAGSLFTFPDNNQIYFSAIKLQVHNEFQLFKQPVNVGAFYMWKPFSVDLRETTFGLLAGYRTGRFGFQLGLNSRVYYFTQAAKMKYNFSDAVSTSIWEPVNVMYRVSYFQPLSAKWEMEAMLTNYDNYIIEQETNPMVQTKFTYKMNEKLNLYADLGYQQAGLLNIRVNTFGIFLRGGVVWKIN
jgi:hypothetical protein